MEELKKEPVTVFLILVNALVFLVVEFTGGSEDTLHMLQCGAAYTPSILDGEYFRIFTCMFLHFGAKHLGNNMLVLFVLGGRMERTVGRIMAAFSLYFGFTSEGVDNAAHVGGLICGFILAVLLYHPGKYERQNPDQVCL